MCTYTTIRADIAGSAKGPGSAWFHLTDATVYFAHPVHAMAEHVSRNGPLRPSNRDVAAF